MNKLKQRISNGEDSYTQFKTNITNSDKLAQELAAFSNIMLIYRADIDRLGEKLGEKYNIELTKNRKTILALMAQDPTITISILSEKIGITTTSIEKNIKFLKENNFIKRVGGAKGGHWETISEI